LTPTFLTPKTSPKRPSPKKISVSAKREELEARIREQIKEQGKLYVPKIAPGYKGIVPIKPIQDWHPTSTVTLNEDTQPVVDVSQMAERVTLRTKEIKQQLRRLEDENRLLQMKNQELQEALHRRFL
jgi:hypothetical protein